MLKTYEELSEELKEEARLRHPEDYNSWLYRVQGVEIAYCAR